MTQLILDYCILVQRQTFPDEFVCFQVLSRGSHYGKDEGSKCNTSTLNLGACVCACMYVYGCMCEDAYVCVIAYAYIFTYIHTYIWMYMCIYTWNILMM